ncbi:hypothetical protein T459_25034 [Capsicum annuum]|uniref:Translation elongation factor P/YeiP central domain-containing protein n=1 Tax=Capsicum annuum TaxID=4072 RepID=A0A2G2YJL9_CAPAN|nr:hypothetical protein T459_25034 [Capsicum annuum]
MPSYLIKKYSNFIFLDQQWPYHQSHFASAWSATQLRGVKSRGSDLKPGIVIEKKGRIYQVVKAQHTTQGRGGAIIQVELHDVDSGSKSSARFRTDETIIQVELHDVDSGSKSSARFRTDETLEKVFVAEKSFRYLYTDEETGNIALMEPETYEQLDVPNHLFGECFVYLQDDMKVHVQLYDERAMSVSIPRRVTCTVAESEIPMRASATPQYKKVLLDNGLTVQNKKKLVEATTIKRKTFWESGLILGDVVVDGVSVGIVDGTTGGVGIGDGIVAVGGSGYGVAVGVGVDVELVDIPRAVFETQNDQDYDHTGSTDFSGTYTLLRWHTTDFSHEMDSQSFGGVPLLAYVLYRNVKSE